MNERTLPTNRSERIRTGVLVISSLRMLREHLVTRLAEAGLDAAEWTAGEATLPLDGQRPSIAIVDARDASAPAVVQRLTAPSLRTRVVLLGTPDGDESIIACIEAGASGYVDADCSVGDLLRAIERVQLDDVVCSPVLAATLFRRIASHRTGTTVDAAMHTLTMRERQVLALLERGLSNKEIGASLNIAVATVKHHVHRVLEKLRVPRRSAAAAQARQRQLRPPPLP